MRTPAWPTSNGCAGQGLSLPRPRRRGRRKSKRELWVCRTCERQTSITAGTVFAGTRTPLSCWFAVIWAASLGQAGAVGASAQAHHRPRLLRDRLRAIVGGERGRRGTNRELPLRQGRAAEADRSPGTGSSGTGNPQLSALRCSTRVIVLPSGSVIAAKGTSSELVSSIAPGMRPCCSSTATCSRRSSTESVSRALPARSASRISWIDPVSAKCHSARQPSAARAVRRSRPRPRCDRGARHRGRR